MENWEIDDIFCRLDQMLRISPEQIRKLKPRWKQLEQTATNTARVFKLQKLWRGELPHFAMLELSTQQSAPFVTLLIGLAERKYKTSQISLVLWWRRLVATGQEHILSYFSWKRLEETFFGECILSSDILRVCTDNEAFLNNITAALSNDKTVDFKIRELLDGLSMQADVRKEWKAWALRNHPDKGGDAETFLKVKLVYDEWNEIQNKLNNTQQE